jgi:hypothetical protein
MAQSVQVLASVKITLAPNDSIIFLLSIETALLITISTAYHLIAPIIAKAIHVFQEVGSIIVFHFVRCHSISACSIIFKAILSFILPVGLAHSILA